MFTQPRGAPKIEGGPDERPESGRNGMIRGEYRYVAQEKVIFGQPAQEALLRQIDQRGARRRLLDFGPALGEGMPEIWRVGDAGSGYGDAEGRGA